VVLLPLDWLSVVVSALPHLDRSISFCHTSPDDRVDRFLAVQVADVELAATSTPDEPQNMWQPSAELLQTSRFGSQVAAAIFWGSGFVSSTVPMDVVPATDVEYYVTAGCAMAGLLFNAFVIGSMASALSSIDSKKQVCRGKIETIGHYLLLHNVPFELRAKILEYYEYLFTSSQSMEDLHLLRDLPPFLATRLALMMNHRIMVRSAPFFSTLSDNALLSVLERLKPIICVPSEVIMLEGQPLRAVHFVQKGLLHCTSAKEPEGRRVCGGESFGLEVVHEVILERMRYAGADDREAGLPLDLRALDRAFAVESATAITYCDLMSLTLAELAKVLGVSGALITKRSTGKVLKSLSDRALRRRSTSALRTRNAAGILGRISPAASVSR